MIDQFLDIAHHLQLNRRLLEILFLNHDQGRAVYLVLITEQFDVPGHAQLCQPGPYVFSGPGEY